jgi:hypothetical protein
MTSPDDARQKKRAATIIGGVVLILTLLGYLGIHVSVYRSAEWTRMSIVATLAIAIVLAIPLTRHGFKHGIKAHRPPTVPASLGVGSLMCAMAAVLLYIPVTFTLPDLYTRVAGTPYERVHPDLSKQPSSGRGGCKYGIAAPGFPRNGVKLAYCASSLEFSALPEHGPMRVIGRETWFGQRIDLIDRAGDHDATTSRQPA